MNHSTKTPTKAQKARFLAMYSLGCIACRLGGHGFEPAQIHHILSGGKRIGHDATIPVCPWHHVGEPRYPYNAATMIVLRGPSLGRHKQAFVKEYGTEQSLLERTNELLKQEQRVWSD